MIAVPLDLSLMVYPLLLVLQHALVLTRPYLVMCIFILMNTVTSVLTWICDSV